MSDIKLIGLNDLKILDEIREIYYQNTGMIISFHHPGRKDSIDFYPVCERSDFCKLIQSTEKGFNKCLESDEKGLITAKKKGDYNIYDCHAGLNDIAIPLVYMGKEIGSIYSGQIIIEEPTEKSFSKVYNKVKYLNIDYNVLKDAYFKVKVIDRERLNFCVKLLSLIANYIISIENELYLHREIIKKDRKIAKQENERIKLEKSFKDLSISVLEFEKKRRKHFSDMKSEDLKNNHKILSAQLFIKSNYSRNIKLDDVAAAIYLSPNYFSSFFKKITGYTFSNYLIKKRIESAKKLLGTTDIPIKQIVYHVGFEDYNYFNRTFRKIEGVPPAQFRKSKGIFVV